MSSGIPLQDLKKMLLMRKSKRAPPTRATSTTKCRNGLKRQGTMRKLANGTLRTYYVCPRATSATRCKNGRSKRVPVKRMLANKTMRTYYVCGRVKKAGVRASRANKATAYTPCKNKMRRKQIVKNNRTYYVCPRRPKNFPSNVAPNFWAKSS